MKIFSNKYFFSIVHIALVILIFILTPLRGQINPMLLSQSQTEIIPYRLVPSMAEGYGCWLEIEFIGLPQSMLEDEELLDALNRLVVSKETGEIGFHERDFKWRNKPYVLVKIQVPSPYSVMPKHTEIEVSPYE